MKNVFCFLQLSLFKDNEAQDSGWCEAKEKSEGSERRDRPSNSRAKVKKQKQTKKQTNKKF